MQYYAINEAELAAFQLAIVIAGGSKSLLGDIKGRKISQDNIERNDSAELPSIKDCALQLALVADVLREHAGMSSLPSGTQQPKGKICKWCKGTGEHTEVEVHDVDEFYKD